MNQLGRTLVNGDRDQTAGALSPGPFYVAPGYLNSKYAIANLYGGWYNVCIFITHLLY
jgi:hypothetical protein